jgi:heme-degrading monooxygenase HmoA
MYARMTTAQAKPGGVDEALRIWDEQVMPQLTQQRGYKGFQTCTNRDGNTLLTLTYWETREDADRTLNSDWMRQILGLFANIFAAPPTQEHYEVVRDERQ